MAYHNIFYNRGEDKLSYADGNYNGEIYIGHVKWNNDYKHVMDFGSAANRDNFLKTHLTKQNGNIGIVPSPNGYIDLAGIIEGIENKNYLYYCNSSDISNTYYCCFITNYEILAKKTTRVYVELDIFQQYFYNSSFYRSILERAHISKNEDNTNWKNYTAPEPVGAPSEIDKNITAFSDISFVPVLTFDAISKPDTPAGSTKLQYYYGGNGNSPQNMTGYYRFKAPSDSDFLSACLYFWSLAETETSAINHMSDLIGFNFLPTWVVNAASWKSYASLTEELNNNNVCEVSDTVSIGGNTLACGYVPTNKKLYTNLCRAYKLWSKNGVSVPIAPNQLANQSSLTIKLSQRPMGGTYKVELVNYKDISKRFFDLQYSYTIAFGINNNVGTAQQTAIQNLNNQIGVLNASQDETTAKTVTGVISNAVGMGIGVAGSILNPDKFSAVTGTINTVVQGVSNFVNQSYTIDRINAEMKRDNFNMQVAANDAVNSITASIGNNSDRTTMTNDFCRLRIAETSPTLENCRIIDDFLTVYGYSIQEIKKPSDYFRTRPLFNYIKTSNCNLTVLAPTAFENILKNIFNNGVTLWHYSYNNNTGYNNFGNYDLNNF